MSSTNPPNTEPVKPVKSRPFRRAVLRGLGVVMPPLLTIVLFLWAWATVDNYVLKPLENGITNTIVFFSMKAEAKESIPRDAKPAQVVVVDKRGETIATERVMREAGSVEGIASRSQSLGWRIVSFSHRDVVYVPVSDNKWIPKDKFEVVTESPGKLIMSTATSRAVYERYVRLRWLQRVWTIPIFLILFITLAYMLGRFLTADVGRMFLAGVEAAIQRLPLVSNVYSSVKQVTDFVFSEREIEFNRVVAVQYPREGIWSIGFVTGESMLDIRSAANEPVLSVLMATSPMPVTGFTITIRKSETIDLDITIDQAIQFIVSCGVVVPAQQQQDVVNSQISLAIARRLEGESSAPDALPTQRLADHTTLPEPSDNGDDAGAEREKPAERKPLEEQ